MASNFICKWIPNTFLPIAFRVTETYPASPILALGESQWHPTINKSKAQIMISSPRTFIMMNINSSHPCMQMKIVESSFIPSSLLNPSLNSVDLFLSNTFILWLSLEVKVWPSLAWILK